VAAVWLFSATMAARAAAAETGSPVFIEDAPPGADGVVLLENLRGTLGRPVVVRGRGDQRTKLHRRVRLAGAAHVVLERIDFEADATDGRDEPWVRLAGDHIELRDCSITAAPGDGLQLSGQNNAVRGGQVAACEGYGIALAGSARVEGVRVISCRRGGVRAAGDAVVCNSLLLHNRGPAVVAEPVSSLRCYHNLAYDNGGGLMLRGCRTARVLNNILVNNYDGVLLGPWDVEIAADPTAEIDYNVYFRHPGKDKLLRGLPYAQGVDLAPLAADSPFGLRLQVGDAVVLGLTENRWAERFDAHSQMLDIVQRLTGPDWYTRCYEDLFRDFQQEDFRPRYTSPAVGRGVDLTAEVPTDFAGHARSSRHPDIGPWAAPAEWWADIESGRAVIVDGTAGLDARGFDCGLGTADRPFATLAKAAAFARWGSRIYVRDSVYRHTAMQTTFSLGPDSVVSGFPGHRPVFSPSEYVDPSRWEKVTEAGLYRLRDWHTFLGYNCRTNAWALDFYGNARIGGPGENVTSLVRNRAKVGEPFRPIRFLTLDRDTPQLLADGVALQQAGGVLGLEELPIGTMSAWGRDVSHLRPGSFMVGRRDLLVSSAVGAGPLQEGQQFPEGRNRNPEVNCRIRGRSVGYVSEFLARPATLWHAVHTYETGDRLWRLDPATTAKFARPETRWLKDGWRRVAADKDSVCWVRQFALPVSELRLGAADGGKPLARHAALAGREKLPVYGWLQRQYQTGDAALCANFDNPYQDYLEVRLPADVEPNERGVEVHCSTGRVEAIWRKSVDGQYDPGVNRAGLAMLSVFRTMETCATLPDTATTARDNWQFGFLVPLTGGSPELLVRMPAAVDPNQEDPWKFTVVDDCLYVFLPGGDSPAGHSIEVACNSTSYTGIVGSNPSFSEWQDAGPLRPTWPSVRVYRTEMDFGSNALEPLWLQDPPGMWSQGLAMEPSDPSGRTLRLLDDVRLDAGDPPGEQREKVLVIRYGEGDSASPAQREFRISSKQIGPERRIVLPSPPTTINSRYAFFIAPAAEPARMAEQLLYVPLKPAPSRRELGQGTFYYDAAEHALYICGFPGSEPTVGHFIGGRWDAVHLVRGLYTLGGNAYGHQKQAFWGAGLGIPADIFDDVSVGFSPGNNMFTVPGTQVRDCMFRWATGEVGRGGDLSGDERHTVDRIRRPELHVDHCIFDVSNSFLFDGNDSPTKNIPFGNHHIWENSYFLPAMCGMAGPWWDQYCFNNVVQNCVFAGRGGVDVEVSENLIVRNNLFTTDKGSAVTFRGTDRGYVLNNTAFRGGYIWFHSEPERANGNEQGQPTYGPSFPVVQRGRVPWLQIDQIGHEKGSTLSVRWAALADQPEVFYCENWDFPTPLLIDAARFVSYRAVGGVAELQRGSYYHDSAARRLYVRPADGKPLVAANMAAPFIPQTESVRRDLVYTLTVVRPGRLSLPHRALSKTELEILEPLQPGETVAVVYFDARGRQTETLPITAAMLTAGRPRLRLAGQPVDERLSVHRAGDRPPLVRVTGSWNDVRPFEAELIPGGTIVASPLMGVQFQVLRGHFPILREGEQYESVFHSRSVYHLASLNNLFLDLRSAQASDAVDNPHHGHNYMLSTEQTDASHSQIDYNCYWKDLRAVPGPLSAYVRWGRELVWNTTSHKEGITLPELWEKTGYEQHGLMPSSYFTLVANPLRHDFRPLPDSPLLGAGVVSRQQVGTFLFDAEGRPPITYKGNERDIVGHPRGDRPTIGAVQNPLPGARACYLSPSGSDGPQRGSRAAPWATADYALARMRPGDLLVLLPGTYRQPIAIRRSGTARDFLHVVAENPPYPTPPKFPTGGATVFDAHGFGDTPAVLLDGCAHVRVAGLRVTKSKARAAVELRQTRDCVLEYVFVDDSANGVAASGRGNTLYECQVTGGTIGYGLAGSLTDVRWCAAIDTETAFHALGPLAGMYWLQNRQLGRCHTAYRLTWPGSDVTLDGNWAEQADCAFDVAGRRIMLVNNIADNAAIGLRVREASDLRVFHNSLIRCGDVAVTGEEDKESKSRVRSALVLNNVFQGRDHIRLMGAPASGAAIWFNYNIYSCTSPVLQFRGQAAERAAADLTGWSLATGWDRNSRLAPLIYQKQQDRNGRWRIRPWAISVSNLTPHFNVGPLGVNAHPYAGGGSYVLDFPQNWRPHGDSGRRVFVFDVQPDEGAAAARAYWYGAQVDYRRADGSRGQIELSRVDSPPDQLALGTFTQDQASGRVYVRLPSDAAEACPIGKHLSLPPRQAIGYYVGRQVQGKAEKHLGKLVTDTLAKAMSDEGITQIDAVANVLKCLCGTPTLDRGCPILGLCRDADGMPRPSVPGTMCVFGGYNGPGRCDIGAAEHGYFVP
jgi:hypothetical protein